MGTEDRLALSRLEAELAMASGKENRNKRKFLNRQIAALKSTGVQSTPRGGHVIEALSGPKVPKKGVQAPKAKKEKREKKASKASASPTPDELPASAEKRAEKRAGNRLGATEKGGRSGRSPVILRKERVHTAAAEQVPPTKKKRKKRKVVLDVTLGAAPQEAPQAPLEAVREKKRRKRRRRPLPGGAADGPLANNGGTSATQPTQPAGAAEKGGGAWDWGVSSAEGRRGKDPKRQAPVAALPSGMGRLVKGGKGGRAWEWFRSIGSPPFVLSPMVGQSELAFRMLCRQHGVGLAYTPMFIASRFVESAQYRRNVWQTCAADRPLIVQLCGNHPSTVLAAAKLVEHDCDAVDLNLGCPQTVAERGNYGAFLMESLQLVGRIVRELVQGLSIPVTAKIRVFKDFEATLQYALLLQEAGVSLLTVHPRQRHQKEEVLADWRVLQQLRASGRLKVPLVANGDMWHWEDVALCKSQCGAHAFMSAQGLLHNPALFAPLCVSNPRRPPSSAASAANGPQAQGRSAGQQVASDSESGGLGGGGGGAGPPYMPLVPRKEWERLGGGEGGAHMRRRRKISGTMAFSLSFSCSIKSKAGAGTEATPAASTSSSGGSGVAAGAGGFGSLMSTPEDVERQFRLAGQYLDWVAVFSPPHPSIVRRHLFFILFDQFQANLTCYDALFTADKLPVYRYLVSSLYAGALSGKLGGGKGRASASFTASGKRRAKRRDGSLAPPPWPTGGGGLNVASASEYKFGGQGGQQKQQRKQGKQGKKQGNKKFGKRRRR